MQARNFQPTDLEYLIEICRLGSIAQAAIQLGVTQPALSKSVRRLEHIAGAPLLDRTSRGVSPTRLGQMLVARAHLVLSELDTTRQLIQETSGVRAGSVALGVAPTLNHDFLPDIIQLALQQRPGLQFHVSEGLFQTLLPRLQQGNLDFIISSPTPAEALASDLHCQPLGCTIFVACVGAGHPLLTQAPIPAAALLQYSWVLVPKPGVLRNHLDTVFMQQGLSALEPQVQTSSTVLSKALIMQQGFIGFLPLEVFATEEQAGLIQRLDLPWLHWQRELSLISRRSRSLSPAAQYLTELIQHAADNRLSRPLS